MILSCAYRKFHPAGKDHRIPVRLFMDSGILAKKSIHQNEIWKAFLTQINVDKKILLIVSLVLNDQTLDQATLQY
jgi:hypothetical protein